jgi:N-acetylmuramoyl-L-alanine amidase
MSTTGQTVRSAFRPGLLSASKALLLAALGSCAVGAASPQVTAVRFWSLGDVTRIAIETTQEASYHAERLDHPDRVFLDLQGVRRQEGTHGLQVIPVGDKLVKQIRIAMVQADIVRVVLDLETYAEYSISQLRNPERIMIELRLAGQGTPTPPARSVTGSRTLVEPAPERPAVEQPAETPAEPPRVVPPAPIPLAPAAKWPKPVPLATPEPVAVARNTPPPARPPARHHTAAPSATPKPPEVAASTPPRDTGEKALAAKRDSRGDRSLIRALGLKLDRVVIDPGHGGHDTGTIGPTGLMEKDLVLDVAKRLGALIAQRLGSEVIYTRTDDTFVPLEERTRLANDKKADLFLSIHANSSRTSRIGGPETFYLNFTTSADALEVAARENATSTTSIHELQDLVQKITLNEKVQESRELANIVQHALYNGLPRNRSLRNRGVKKAPFVVLIGAQMPSVLAEIAFVSNPKDEALLKRPDYRQKIAEALLKGVSQYADALSHLEVARQRQAASQNQ